MIAALMWFLMILFWIIAFGFAICISIFLFGLAEEVKRWWKARKDWTDYDSWSIAAFLVMVLIAAGLCMGAIFAAIAMSNNLL